MQENNKGYKPIEDYGLIGNMKTVALVSMEGSIDFMCYPDFDSPSVFAKLLDQEKGGSFSITPQISDFKTKQLYLPGTAVLLTRFFSEEGIAELTDYMPVNSPNGIKTNTIVRMIKTVRGSITYRINCDPAFSYAMATHTTELKNNELRFTT